MSRSYTSSPPQAPPWRVTGLLYFYPTIVNGDSSEKNVLGDDDVIYKGNSRTEGKVDFRAEQLVSDIDGRTEKQALLALNSAIVCSVLCYTLSR
jgi:hypothetical protein